MRRGSRPAAGLLAAVVVCAGCSNPSEGSRDTGGARVSVTAGRDAVLPEGATVRLVISDRGEAPTFSPRPVILPRAGSNGAFTGNVQDIPATPAGSVRLFRAEAYAGHPGAGDPLYAGETLATVFAGKTSRVTIILQDVHQPPGGTNQPPVIVAVSTSPMHAMPGESGRFSVTATDPDGNGFDASHPLSFEWSATCASGELRFGAPENGVTPSGASTSSIPWTAPLRATVCTAAVVVRESPAVVAVPLSVTAYFSLVVDTGSAGVLVLLNGAPILTVAGDFAHAGEGSGSPPLGLEADLHFTAVDPDGDDVRFELSARCGIGFEAAAASDDVPSACFSAVSFRSSGGLGLPGPSIPVAWDPTFGYPAPVAVYPYPLHDCIFRVDVHDLCTRGNCGPPGAAGALPDGADKDGGSSSSGSVTTGHLFVAHPALWR